MWIGASVAATRLTFALARDRRIPGSLAKVSDRYGTPAASIVLLVALSAAVIVPPIYSVPLPQPEILPADTAELVRRARAHPAGAYALELFERHRRERVA